MRRRKPCAKHDWVSCNYNGMMKCSKCPKMMQQSKLDQLNRARKQRELVAAARKRKTTLVVTEVRTYDLDAGLMEHYNEIKGDADAVEEFLSDLDGPRGFLSSVTTLQIEVK